MKLNGNTVNYMKKTKLLKTVYFTISDSMFNAKTTLSIENSPIITSIDELLIEYLSLRQTY